MVVVERGLKANYKHWPREGRKITLVNYSVKSFFILSGFRIIWMYNFGSIVILFVL